MLLNENSLSGLELAEDRERLNKKPFWGSNCTFIISYIH